jgi:hypothetical protein
MLSLARFCRVVAGTFLSRSSLSLARLCRVVAGASG